MFLLQPSSKPHHFMAQSPWTVSCERTGRVNVQAVSPVLFGRDTELAELQRWLETGSARPGSVLLVSGEAGLGKSRLIEEALQLPAAAPYRHIRVTCLEGDEAEPYSLTRALVTAVGGSAAAVTIAPAPEAERQVRQVQQALSALLYRVPAAPPLLLAVDDIHWSDGPSLQVLLALTLQPHPLHLLLSYRPEPVTPGLASFLADASRLRLGQSIRLAPLASASTARMIRAMLSLLDSLPPALLDEIMAATGGIPFLVEELVHTLVRRGDLTPHEGGWRFRRGSALSVPRSLRHTVEARLLPQPPAVVAVAELAAVAGQMIDIARLVRLSALDEPALLAALRSLVEAQILVPQPDGALAFRHALTREAIRTRLLHAERQALHRRVAQMLEAEAGVSPSMLAYHWSQAGDAKRAATYAWRAARAAAAVHAHREAITHYELALAGSAAPREEILRALGDQHRALAEFAHAIIRYQEAQALYRAAGDTTAVALLDLRIGDTYGQQRARPEAHAHLQAAFSQLPAAHPERWRAGLSLGLQEAAAGSYDEAEATFLAAQQAAGNLPLARLRIAYELGGLRALRGDWAALEAAGQQVLREAPEDSDEGLALRHDAHAALGSVAYYRGALAASLDHFTACLDIAGRRALANDLALARWNLATNALYHLGRWHEAREQLAELQATVATDAVQAAILFELWLDGRWEEAAAIWLRNWPDVRASDDLELQMAFARRIADLLLALGRPQEVLELLAPLLVAMRALPAPSFLLQLLPRQVEALARLGDERAQTVAAEGLAMARKLGGRPAEGLLLRGRALARQNARRWLDAFADFDAAVAILEALPMPYEAARTLREAGLARLARGRRGDRERAAALLRQARQIFADLGARRDESATEAILSAAGLAAAHERGPGPLTVREHEVASLVTEGLSNREIAERLFITEKTAAYHVGNILSKLDFSSRAQIAAYMAQNE
jgi:DNA-binding CsgD family transcriptional regulator